MGYKLYRRDGGDRWHAYFIDREGNRQRCSTKQTDKRRAGLVADEWYRRLADPSYSAANSTTLQSASKHLIEALKRAKRSKQTTGHFYPTKLSHLARLWGEDMPLARIDAKLVDGYIASREGEGASAHTISKELTALRQLLKHARRRGEFDKELSQVMPIGYATGYTPRTRRLTMDEARAFIAVLPANVARYVAFVLCTTARDAAVARARSTHFWPHGIEVFDLKTKGSARTVPRVAFLDEFAVEAIAGVQYGSPIAPGLGSVRHAFDRAAKRLGIGHVSPNDLRRSVAHWLLERGVPRDAAAAFMGHANTKMLDAVYGKLDTKELGASIARALTSGAAGYRCGLSSFSPVDLSPAGAPREPAPSEGTSLVGTANLSPAEAPVGPASISGSSVEETWKNGSKEGNSQDSVDDGIGLKAARRGGIEPPTRGFSVPTILAESSEKPHETSVHVDDSWRTIETSEAGPKGRAVTSLPVRGSGETGALETSEPAMPAGLVGPEPAAAGSSCTLAGGGSEEPASLHAIGSHPGACNRCSLNVRPRWLLEATANLACLLAVGAP